MSVREVRAEIRRAMVTHGGCDNAHISEDEGKNIAKVAAKGGVTPAEAKALEDLIDKGHPMSPGTFMTMACPEMPRDHYTIDPKATGAINSLFARSLLPYGDNKGSLRQQIKDTLDTLLTTGDPLAHAPSISRLHPILLEDNRPVDGARRDAFINPSKKEFFLKTTGSGMGGPETIGPFWHGPFKIQGKAGLKPETVDALRTALNRDMSTLTWSSGLPLGVRMESVELMRERHPDGFAYTAMVPVGALSPTAPRSDPNEATQFYVKRSGGFAGLTQYAGPIQIHAE